MSTTIELGDVAIPVGSYEKNGQTKRRNRNIGKLMETTQDSGARYLWLKLNGDALNPSLLILTRPLMEKGADQVLCSVFEPRQQAAAAPEARAGAGTPPPEEDDIPF